LFLKGQRSSHASPFTLTMKAGVVSAVFVAKCLCASESPAAPFEGHKISSFGDWKPPVSNDEVIATATVKKTFEDVAQKASAGEGLVLSMEAAMEPTFRALPKNKYGLLSRNAVAYLVSKYFEQVHHLNIRGLSSIYEGGTATAANVSAGMEGKIGQSSAPQLLESLVESHASRQGVGLKDAALLAATLHTLVMDHSAASVLGAISAAGSVGMLTENYEKGFSMPSFIKIIHAWQWLHRHDFKTDPHLFLEHMDVPTHIMDEFGKLASDLAEAKFYRERNVRNPFRQNTLSIAEARTIAQKATEEMGLWQEGDCRDMKWYLARMDSDGNGRVPLEDVYDAKTLVNDEHGEQIFRIAESQDYLREIGALDECIPGNPQLLISNYILGPSNCYKSLTLHTYCCPNECDRVLRTIEWAVEGPTAKPDILLAAVGSLMNTSIMMNEQQLSGSLVKKLADIAKRNGNAVPLHGRLFAQWLHFAFPRECPYPHIAHKDAAGNTLMTSFFNPPVSRPALARGDKLTAALEDPLMQWTDDEVLPLAEEAEGTAPCGWCRSILRIIFMVLAVLALLNQLWGLASSGNRTFQTEMWGRDLDKLV